MISPPGLSYDGETARKQLGNLRRAICNWNAGRFERGDLALWRSEVSGDDRSGVAQRFTRRCVSSADERHDRHAGHVLGDECRRVFFVRSTDLAANDERLGLRIVLELAQAIDERRTDYRVAADTDAGRLPHPGSREQVDDLVRQRSRADRK